VSSSPCVALASLAAACITLPGAKDGCPATRAGAHRSSCLPSDFSWQPPCLHCIPLRGAQTDGWWLLAPGMATWRLWRTSLPLARWGASQLVTAATAEVAVTATALAQAAAAAASTDNSGKYHLAGPGSTYVYTLAAAYVERWHSSYSFLSPLKSPCLAPTKSAESHLWGTL
jgi:hypothetical protein